MGVQNIVMHCKLYIVYTVEFEINSEIERLVDITLQ
jgi:diacylglycerol kinase